jgi:hypothetical protein
VLERRTRIEPSAPARIQFDCCLHGSQTQTKACYSGCLVVGYLALAGANHTEGSVCWGENRPALGKAPVVAAGDLLEQGVEHQTLVLVVSLSREAIVSARQGHEAKLITESSKSVSLVRMDRQEHVGLSLLAPFDLPG